MKKKNQINLIAELITEKQAKEWFIGLDIEIIKRNDRIIKLKKYIKNFEKKDEMIEKLIITKIEL